MKQLIIQEFSPQNQLVKTQKLRPKIKTNKPSQFFLLGCNNQADYQIQDRLSSPIEYIIKYQNNKWSIIDFDVNAKNNDKNIINEVKTVKLKNNYLKIFVQNQDENLIDKLLNSTTESYASEVLSPSKKSYLVSILMYNNKKYKIDYLDPQNSTLILSKLNLSALTKQDKENWSVYTHTDFTVYVSKNVKTQNLFNHQNEPKHLIKNPQFIGFSSFTILFLGLAIFTSFAKHNSLPVEAEAEKQPAATYIVLKPQKGNTQKVTQNPAENVAAMPSGAAPQAKQNNVQSARLALAQRISKLLTKANSQQLSQNAVTVTTSNAKATNNRGLASVESINMNNAVAGKGAGNGSGDSLSQHLAQSGLAQGIQLNGQKVGQGKIKLIEDESEATGGLDKEVIASYIKTQIGQILYCYERQLSAQPDLIGKVSVKFTITATGKIASASINQTSLNSKPVENCILNKISSWKFPEPKGGSQVVVTYPFLFKSI